MGSLGLAPLAEGAETEEQAGLLKGYGGDMVQGYLFSRAIRGQSVARLLLADRATSE